MRILLITPLAKYSGIRWLPLGLSYISSILKEAGHEVSLYDRFLRGHVFNNRNVLDEDMKRAIFNFHPDIIGFTTISSLIHDTVESAAYIRNFYDGILIAGGHHATALPELTLKKIPGLDFVASGESENSMFSLANGEDPKNITGLYSRQSAPVNKDVSHIRNLDELPLPDHKIFDMDHYTRANHQTIKGFYLRTACVLSARGCPNRCEFCSESLTFGRGIRFHSPDYVIENIERLVTDYGVEGIYFHDNNFLASPSHAEKLCKALIKSGLNKKIKWEMQTGTPTLNDDILALLSEAGCIKIELGIESIKGADLENMNKNASTDINIRAIDLCHKHGMTTHTNFMTGFEGETVQDLNNTIEWIKKFRPHTFSFHRVQVYPGTMLYEKIGNDFFASNDWTEKNITGYFNNQKYDSISLEDRKNWYFKTYKPFNTRYIRKSILKVNSLKNIFIMIFKKILKKD